MSVSLFAVFVSLSFSLSLSLCLSVFLFFLSLSLSISLPLSLTLSLSLYFYRLPLFLCPSLFNSFCLHFDYPSLCHFTFLSFSSIYLVTCTSLSLNSLFIYLFISFFLHPWARQKIFQIWKSLLCSLSISLYSQSLLYLLYIFSLSLFISFYLPTSFQFYIITSTFKQTKILAFLDTICKYFFCHKYRYIVHCTCTLQWTWMQLSIVYTVHPQHYSTYIFIHMKKWHALILHFIL